MAARTSALETRETRWSPDAAKAGAAIKIWRQLVVNVLSRGKNVQRSNEADDAWKENLVPLVESRVKELLLASPACHDWDHTQRVRFLALRLAAAEGADALIVEVGALLHDIGRPAELADQGRTCHAALGGRLARDVLVALGVESSPFVTAVVDCVRCHRHRRRDADASPETLEAKVVYDADKLDSMGAIGIGRSFHFAGRIGARVHNTAAEALGDQSYGREDSAYREYLVKLRFLKDKMMTASGARLATRRHHVMAEFFAELDREVRGED